MATTQAAVGQAAAKLTAARQAARHAEIEFAQAGQRVADEAAQHRREELARKPKQATFRMSPRTAAAKLVYDCRIPAAAAKWFEEILSRLEALEENSSATPPHMRAVERR